MFVADLFKSRCRLEAENLFLRHQPSPERMGACVPAVLTHFAASATNELRRSLVSELFPYALGIRIPGRGIGDPRSNLLVGRMCVLLYWLRLEVTALVLLLSVTSGKPLPARKCK